MAGLEVVLEVLLVVLVEGGAFFDEPARIPTVMPAKARTTTDDRTRITVLLRSRGEPVALRAPGKIRGVVEADIAAPPVPPVGSGPVGSAGPTGEAGGAGGAAGAAGAGGV